MVAGKKRLSKIEAGRQQKVGANLDASLYNELIDFGDAIDRDMSWFVRVSLKKFVEDHREALGKDPVQLSLDLSRI